MGASALIYDQNAAYAEEYAASSAIREAERPAHLVIDREATLRHVMNRRKACSYRSPTSGRWRIFDENQWPTGEKVDIHTDEEAAIRANDHARWFGNDFANKYAKLGADRHPFSGTKNKGQGVRPG